MSCLQAQAALTPRASQKAAIAMILAFTRGIRDSILAQQHKQWAIGKIRPKMVELTNSTMGIYRVWKYRTRDCQAGKCLRHANHSGRPLSGRQAGLR